MSIPDDDLAAMLASRICHDLISPLGAISNGVELLGMGNTDLSPEVALIAESASSANARVRFFRVAFGVAKNGQRMSAVEVRAVLGDYSAQGRLRHAWKPEGDFSRREVKIAFLVLMCLESSMPYGGTVDIDCVGGGWSLCASAGKLRPLGDLWSLAASGVANEPPTPATIHFALLAREIQTAGRQLAARFEAEGITVDY